MLEELIFNYQQLSTPIAQGAELFRILSTKIEEKREGSKKVAIIYSANEGQAEALYDFYFNPNSKKDFKKIIHGHNQADVFKVLSHLLDGRYGNHLKDKVRILPIATIKKKKGTSDKPTKTRSIIRDLTNIQQHLEDNWHVYVLTNTPQQVQEDKHKYQIGGGSAVYFYDDKKKMIAFGKEVLSVGAFVERCIDCMIRIYSDSSTNSLTASIAPASDAPETSTSASNASTSDDISVERSAIEAKTAPRTILMRVLKPYQQMLLSVKDDAQYGFTKMPKRPDSLTSSVREALKRKYIITDKTLIHSVMFSPSWNLRIEVSQQAPIEVAEKLVTMLAAYGARKYSTAISNAAVPASSFTTGTNAQRRVTIHHQNVIPFLMNYCEVPYEDLICFVAKAIGTNPRNSSEIGGKKKKRFIAITPHYILLDDEIFTLKEANDKQQFGVPHENPRESVGKFVKSKVPQKFKPKLEKSKGIRHPEKVYGHLRSIMNKLSGLNADLQCYRYQILPNLFDPLAEYPDLNKLVASINDQTSIHAVKNDLHSLVWGLYNALTSVAIELYTPFKFKDFWEKRSPVREAIGECHSVVSNGIRCFLIEDNKAIDVHTRYLQYWIYMQLAFLAYIKGNIFLFSAIMIPLKNYSELFLEKFPTDFSTTFNFLMSKAYDKDSFADAKMIAHVNFYRMHFGASLPVLANFIKWKEYVGPKEKEGFAMIDERLEPVLRELHAAPIPKWSSNLDTIFKAKKANQRKVATELSQNKNATELNSFLTKLCQHSLWIDMVQSAEGLADKLHIKLLCKGDALLGRFLEMLGTIFSNNIETNPIIKLFELKEFDLLSSVLRYNLVTSHMLDIQKINATIKSMDRVAKESAEKLIGCYLIDPSKRPVGEHLETSNPNQSAQITPHFAQEQTMWTNISPNSDASHESAASISQSTALRN